jgi:hypothetical protein
MQSVQARDTLIEEVTRRLVGPTASRQIDCPVGIRGAVILGRGRSYGGVVALCVSHRDIRRASDCLSLNHWDLAGSQCPKGEASLEACDWPNTRHICFGVFRVRLRAISWLSCQNHSPGDAASFCAVWSASRYMCTIPLLPPSPPRLPGTVRRQPKMPRHILRILYGSV